MSIICNLKKDIKEYIKNAGYEVENLAIETSNRKDLGEYQLNDAMQLAKKYKEKDNTMVIYNYNKKKLIRENKELKIEYIFSEKNNTEGKLFIKDINQSMAILIKTKKIMQDELNIYIEFNIDKKVFKYRIEAIKWV